MANSVFISWLGAVPVQVSGTTIVLDATLDVDRLLVGDGTAGAPSVAAASQTNAGWYFRAGAWEMAPDGVGRYRWASGDFKFLSNGSISFSSGVLSDASDLRLSRPAAGVMALGGLSTGVRLNASTDGTLAIQNFAGTQGATVNAGAYVVGGTAGADFNGAVTNLTVVKGIVTAAS